MGYFKQFLYFIRDILQSRQLILELARADFRKKYLGSYLGIIWAFIQPTLTILIFWFVFQVGFKSTPVENFPFVLWLMAGIVPWFFFAEGVAGASYSIVENSFLVNKVVFRVSVLPIIKILSALVIHLFFVLFLAVMFMLYGYMPSIYYIQVFYYLAAMVVLVLGISWITSSLVVFVKDVGQAIPVIVQFGFWLTPVFWSVKMLPEKYLVFVKLNPVHYIIEGYRNTFIYQKWFWENGTQALYFWTVTLVLFAVGAIVFKRLRPHFADFL